jgi:tRNA threonylcarbamoyladenosine biosynthesis protein TsaE
MSGPLGSGKTKTVETFLRQMGFAGSSSPTFALHQVYETKPVSIDHFDLYRIESEDELAGAGVYEVFEKPSGLVFIEWAERLGDLENFFVPDWQIIHFEFYFENGLRQLKMRFNLGR